MKKSYLLHLLLVFAAALICNFKVMAQNAEVAIEGDVAKPFKVDASTFKTMNRVSVKVTDHDGKQHEYSGVPVYDLLVKAEAVPNNQLRGKALLKYALISAADGYQVVVALPEIDPVFADQTVILADKQDGEDLPPNLGPFRLIIPRDKKPARSVMRVTSITIMTAKKS